MSNIIGMRANNDATAASHGVSGSDHIVDTHQQDIDDAVREDVEMHEKYLSKIDSDGQPSSNATLDNDDDECEMRRRQSAVQNLARSFSQASTHPSGNPFQADKTSPLNPASPNFNARAWAKAMVDLVAPGGEGLRSTGVCFQNMNVFGFGEATDYQKDVFNVWLSLAGMARGLWGNLRQRIDILHDVDGLVRKGEMLVVLGPPGSGCSTFLKTISGEMNGLWVDDSTYFNYQGMSCIRLGLGSTVYAQA